MRYYLIPVKMAIEEDVEKKGLLHTGGGNINRYSHYEEQNGGSSKN